MFVRPWNSPWRWGLRRWGLREVTGSPGWCLYEWVWGSYEEDHRAPSPFHHVGTRGEATHWEEGLPDHSGIWSWTSRPQSGDQRLYATYKHLVCGILSQQPERTKIQVLSLMLSPSSTQRHTRINCTLEKTIAIHWKRWICRF